MTTPPSTIGGAQLGMTPQTHALGPGLHYLADAVDHLEAPKLVCVRQSPTFGPRLGHGNLQQSCALGKSQRRGPACSPSDDLGRVH
jgi:hypothetical protein